MEKEELYADPESTPTVTSVFVSLVDTSKGGQHQYEYIDPKMKEDNRPPSPEYAHTEASSSPHNELVGNGYNTLTHDLGPPCNHYNKLDHTLPKKRDGSDSLYSSLNEGKDSFYNSLEEIDKKGCDGYANICHAPSTGANSLPLLFDDPNYSPVRTKKPHPPSVDKKYTGDYERAPDYVARKHKLNSKRDAATTANGDYISSKKSDDYIPMSPPKSAINPSALSTGMDEKYTGEYERAPDYVPPDQASGQKHMLPPHTSGEGAKSTSKSDHNEYIAMSIASTHPNATPTTSVLQGTECTGDYERDPNYCQDRSSTPQTDYQSLADSLMDSPHHYAHPGQN